MQQDLLKASIHKLAIAGENAGLTVEDMISLLNAGLAVEALLCLIENRLTATEPMLGRSSSWIM